MFGKKRCVCLQVVSHLVRRLCLGPPPPALLIVTLVKIFCFPVFDMLQNGLALPTPKRVCSLHCHDRKALGAFSVHENHS